MVPLRTVAATRYVTPLREGGSMPAIVEADDLGTYVLKFRGAGQGTKALVAELVAGQIAAALGLAVPDMVFMELDPALGQNEPDAEIRALIKSSAGVNLAFDYLPGSLGYEPGLLPVDRDLAARVVWFDALVTNVDRTPRNTNLLMSRGQLWLIDHGAALYVHHRWAGWRERIQTPFPRISEHVLLPFAGSIEAADARLRSRIDQSTIEGIVAELPEDWLAPEPEAEIENAAALRQAYTTYLIERLNGPRQWLAEAVAAHGRGPETLKVRETHRVV